MAAIKGVILAAGLGSRLKPLTDALPKPLLPFCGVPIFYLAAARLLEAGIHEIAANAHYFPEKIIEAAKRNPFSVDIHVSVERETILGTAGVYGNLQRWRGTSDLLAVNGDIVSNFNLHKLIDSHEQKNPWVTLGLVKGENPSGNSIWIDSLDRVLAISRANPTLVEKGLRPHIFSGFQVLSNDILAGLSENTPADLIAIFQEGLRKGKVINGFYQDCFWHDLGTPLSYFNAHKEFLDGDSLLASQQMRDHFGYRYAVERLGLKIQYFREPVTTDSYRIVSPSLFIDHVDIGSDSIVGPYAVITGRTRVPASTQISLSLVLGSLAHVHKATLRNVIVHDGLVTPLKV